MVTCPDCKRELEKSSLIIEQGRGSFCPNCVWTVEGWHQRDYVSLASPGRIDLDIQEEIESE